MTNETIKEVSTFYGITIGTVVDVNDPQQMGRIRVLCPGLGDNPDQHVTDVQWASYAAPFGGITAIGTRGPEQGTSSGPVAYGTWGVPKVGAHALVMCIDGHLDYRVWIGCLYGSFLPHTLPMGRYVNQNADGPFTSTEKPVEPLYTNMRNAFTRPGGAAFNEAFEAKTRALENQVCAVDEQVMDRVIGSVADDKFDGTETPGTGTRKGYQQSRQRPDIHFQTTGGNFDSQIYSITTPGMHSFIMDDSIQNGRVRIRSTSGNQIILDDTNERIYISTAGGKNWIELDKNGNVDIHSSKRVSLNADQGFNFTTLGDFRVTASNIHLNALSNLRMTSVVAMDLSSAVLHLTSDGILDVVGTGGVNIESGAVLNIKSAGVMTIGGASLALQPSGAPETVPSATVVSAARAYSTNRIPQHEPWGRTMVINTDNDDALNFSTQPEYEYTAPEVGKFEFGVELEPTRNIFWRR